MAATAVDGANSVLGCALRLGRLGATGAPVAGATGMYANKRFVKVTSKNVYEAGTELTLKTACDALDVSYRGFDMLKRIDIEIEFTYPDPAALDISCGARVLTDGAANPVGFGEPRLLVVATPNGCSLEVWEQAILVDALGSPAYFRHCWPRAYLEMRDHNIEGKPNTWLIGGYAIENPNWGKGPMRDFTSDGTTTGAAVDTAGVHQVIRDGALPGTLQPGYQTAVP